MNYCTALTWQLTEHLSQTSNNIFVKAYSGISRNMWLLAIAMFLNRCGSMVLLFMSVYLSRHLNFSLPQAGFVMAMFGCGSLCGAFTGGRLVDKIGFYPILIWSLLLSGIMLLLLGQMHSFALIAVFTFLVTFTGDAFRPANSASISTYSGKDNYTQSISLNRLAMNLGFTIGPALGGLLATISYSFLFWVDGITCIVAALFIAFTLPKPSVKPESSNKTNQLSGVEDDKQKKQFVVPYRDRRYLAFLFFGMLYATAFFQFITAMPLYFKNYYHLSERSIGSLMSLNGIGVALVEMFIIYNIAGQNSTSFHWASFFWLSVTSYWYPFRV